MNRNLFQITVTGNKGSLTSYQIWANIQTQDALSKGDQLSFRENLGAAPKISMVNLSLILLPKDPRPFNNITVHWGREDAQTFQESQDADAELVRVLEDLEWLSCKGREL